MPIAAAGVTEISGITGQSRDSFALRTKDEYVPAWADHVHKGTKIASLIAKKKGTMGGKRTLTSVQDSLPQSAGIALFEYDDMPTPRVGTYFNPELYSRKVFSRLRWTLEVEIMARKGDKVAWAQPRTEDLKKAREQFNINYARMLYLGPQQILGTVLSQSSETSTMYSRDARSSAADDRHKYGTHYLRKNMSVSAVAPAASAVVPDGDITGNVYAEGGANERYISAISVSTPTAPTFTVNSAWQGTAPADEAIIVPYRSRAVDGSPTKAAGNDSLYAGPNGLMNLVADASRRAKIYNVARSSQPSLEGFMDTQSGVRTPWNEMRISHAVDKVNDDGLGDGPSVLLMNRSVRREYVKETSGDRRFEPVLKTKGYAAKLQFQAGDQLMTIVTDRDCQPGLVWALETDGFGWLSEADMQAVGDGERFVANKAATEQLYFMSGNCMTERPCNNCLIDDISDSVYGLTTL